MSRVDIDSAAIHELFRDRSGPVGQAMEAAAFRIENRMKELLLAPGSGQVYTTRFFTDAAGRVRPVGHRPPHRASAPGQPPASDTGRLLTSISHNITVEDTLIGRIGSDLKYAEYLELGHGLGRGGRAGYVEPRPFMRPALDAVRT